MELRFWGTRGAFASPGGAFKRYGGSTICTEVVSASGGRLVVDLGTGAIALGNALAGQAASRRLAVVLTHTQIDHIQGLPFFTPALMGGWDLTLLGPSYAGRDIAGILDHSLNPDYSPLYSLGNFTARLQLHTLTEGDLAWEGLRIRTRELSHGGTKTIGLRIEEGGATAALISDVAGERTPSLAALDLASDADVLIHDGMEAIPLNPGRSCLNATPEHALEVAREAGAKVLYLYHHHPDATDPYLDTRLQSIRAGAGAVRVEGAKEVQAIRL